MHPCIILALALGSHSLQPSLLYFLLLPPPSFPTVQTGHHSHNPPHTRIRHWIPATYHRPIRSKGLSQTNAKRFVSRQRTAHHRSLRPSQHLPIRPSPTTESLNTNTFAWKPADKTLPSAPRIAENGVVSRELSKVHGASEVKGAKD